MFRFENVTLTAKNKLILKDFNLDINQGDKVLITGKSGIGKSTILNLLLGFRKPNSGTIYFHNKALNKKELIHLRRGVYVLDEKYRTKKFSKYYIASQIVGPSYISFETSLAYHQLIPERVEIIESAISIGRTRYFDTPLGYYQYRKMPVVQYAFLNNTVKRGDKDQPFLMAKPLRAIIDIVCRNKIDEFSFRYLTDGLRIEPDELQKITKRDFESVSQVYRYQNIQRFIKNFQRELGY